jgi:hypothetical protein
MPAPPGSEYREWRHGRWEILYKLDATTLAVEVAVVTEL